MFSGSSGIFGGMGFGGLPTGRFNNDVASARLRFFRRSLMALASTAADRRQRHALPVAPAGSAASLSTHRSAACHFGRIMNDSTESVNPCWIVISFVGKHLHNICALNMNVAGASMKGEPPVLLAPTAQTARSGRDVALYADDLAGEVVGVAERHEIDRMGNGD